MDEKNLSGATVERRPTALEARLTSAKTIKWSGCPRQVLDEVTPLAQFIVSPDLQRAVAAVGLEQLELADQSSPASDQDIADGKTEAMIIVLALEQSDIARDHKPLYHNAEHARQTIQRIEQLIRSSKKPLTQEQVRACFVAAAYHDAGHPGYSRKANELDPSIEQDAAKLADDYATEHGLTLRQRSEIYTAIIATSFWDPAIQPTTQIEHMLQLADLGGYMESLNEWIEQSLQVASETAATQPVPPFVANWLYAADIQTAVQQWLTGQGAFIKFVLRPAHNKFAEHYVADAQEWTAESALHEKEATVAGMIQNPTDSAYGEFFARISQTLTELRGRYGKK